LRINGCGTDVPGRETLDEATVAEIYRLHSDAILRMLRRVAGTDHARAEDILQETLLRAWQHPESTARGVEESRPWLLTVARRIAIDHFRMRAARPEEIGDESCLAAAVVPDEADRVLADHDVAVALSQLHPRYRDVLVELHVRDRSLKQAAETLGLPVGTVKSRSFHAVRALRPVLEARGLVGAGPHRTAAAA
jgi:RNA polymerase sigma-70 factor (ECF subfamily)